VSIGVLLGGCGHYDGTDAHELVLVLMALETAGERAALVAPDIPQERTVDHLSGDEVAETRNVLRESARLARRPIHSLETARLDDLEGLVIPGGYGPVVNFSTGFARPGAERRMNPAIASFLRHFLDEGKPIGCVSLGEIPLRTVIGDDLEVPPPPADPRALSVDRDSSIVHTPGFTSFTRLSDVRTGIEAMVGEVVRMVRERRAERAAAARHPGDGP